MSERERAKQIIDSLPEYKIANILVFLEGIKFDDDMEDDLFCQQLVDRYEADPEKNEEYSLEDCKKEWGFDSGVASS